MYRLQGFWSTIHKIFGVQYNVDNDERNSEEILAISDEEVT